MIRKGFNLMKEAPIMRYHLLRVSISENPKACWLCIRQWTAVCPFCKYREASLEEYDACQAERRDDHGGD